MRSVFNCDLWHIHWACVNSFLLETMAIIEAAIPHFLASLSYCQTESTIRLWSPIASLPFASFSLRHTSFNNKYLHIHLTRIMETITELSRVSEAI